MIKDSIRTGLSFGLTSGIITTLGLITGLGASTRSKTVVIGGILTIAIADAFSDALGIHISEEAEAKHSPREIWASTISTFAAKFLFASVFILPVALLELRTAIIVSAAMGLSFLGVFSFVIAKREGINPRAVVLEHLIIAVVVLIATNFVGEWISRSFG